MNTTPLVVAQVEALRAQITDTKTLYREVAALLFFKHGMKPTAGGLYQLVKKGSMSVPTEVLQQFWEDIRSKASINIDQPGLPDSIKAATVALLNTIWSEAVRQAVAELNAARLESDDQVALALRQVEDERERAAETRRELNAAESEMARLADLLTSMQEDLQKERNDHAETSGRAGALEQEILEDRRQMAQARSNFSEEVARLRDDLKAAQQRFDSNERRALLEIDQARVAKTSADKQLAEARELLLANEAERRSELTARVATIATLTAEVAVAHKACAGHEAALRELRDALSAKTDEAAAQRSRADTVQALLHQLDGSPSKPTRQPKQPRERRSSADKK